MTQLLARRAGIRLLTAHTAELGIELALADPPDLLVMDINLPGLDGREALRVLRRDDRLQATPVIALSANAMPDDIDRGLRAGFAAYLTKPLQLEPFFALLDRYLNSPPRQHPDSAQGDAGDDAAHGVDTEL